ncbi:two-component regulator propeller domain-containing protein [uncultured Draconibacterium sp.]|uniref:hybrid sensor histidine kinase/response regulator transcription factor n=1 Tax=uncultured Draconibacterium sp. TaxID=1573823 RepID=UPI0032175D5A
MRLIYMLNRLKHTSVLLLVLVINSVAFAFNTDVNPDQIRFNYITTNNGLPQNTVDCILKDSRGFMWFGTWNGVCRYDGYTFKTYQRNQGMLSLPGNFIQTLCEDDLGNIWVGTNKGLVYFDSKNLKFVAPDLLKENVGNFSINHILKDKNGDLWVATEENGLWKITINTDQKIHSTKVISEKLQNRNINNLCLLNGDCLFVGTEFGLVVLNVNDTSVNTDWKQVEEALEGQDISKIYLDSRGNIWAGTFGNGLFIYEKNSTNPRYIGAQADVDTDLNHLTVYDIVEDNNGIVIVGTLGGLNYYNYQNKTFSHLSAETETVKYLNSPFVNSLYSDKSGNIWIGTEMGGVNYYNSFQKPFNSIKHDPSNYNTISHNTVNSIFKDKNNLWIGTAGGGLNKLFANGKQNTRFVFDPENQGSLNSNFVSSIFKDRHNNLWIGTWGGGLNLLLSEYRNEFRIIVNDPANSGSLCNSFVSSLKELDEYRILVGTRDGLDIFNPTKNSFLHVHEKMHIDNALEVGCLLSDQNDRIWVGTRNGLIQLSRKELLRCNDNTESVAFKKFTNQSNDPGSLSGNYVISLLETKDGTIWIGTYGHGICKYQEKDGQDVFINYSEEQGLCNNVTYAMEEDRQGNLWISTDKGLSKFNPITEEFQNFYTSDGLLSDQFYWASSFADENGVLYYGGIEGLNYFLPEQIEPYPNTPQPVFTEFSVFNTPVKVGDKYHSEIILNAPIEATDKINLSYKDAVFSIEFSALDYFLPNKIKYAYKMEGVDQDWVEVPSTRRFANYTNLSGGNYTFKIKATNSDGIWSENERELLIYVNPPFWETAWFQFLAVIAIIFLVMAYIRYRTRFLKEQKQKLEKQVRERTSKIEEQKEELEKQNLQIAKQRDEVIDLNEQVKLVNQLRLRFFTNISHEFRTPLTLIIDPLEQLMQNLKDDQNARNTISIINRNAQRLLHLINQLLYFRRIETGKLNLNVSIGNLEDFLGGIFESFKDLAEHQQINYRFISAKTDEDTWFDAEKIENVFYNLLSNAFKNTPVPGSITVKMEYIKNNGQDCIQAPFVSIGVIDSGSGISKEHLPNIFNRFYKAEQGAKGSNFTSSGIGLALTYEIVQALHGEIKVESELGKGSLFTVCIPYSKDRFSAEEINETTVPSDLNLEGRVNVLSEHIIARESGYKEENDVQDDKSKPTLLIVEDNFDLRSFLLQTLRNEYRVLGAENGKIGLEMAKKYSPELIISDVMMPVMDGIELCSRLKKNIQTSHIPIVLLTAKNMVESWIEGLETGADDYIPKPFNLQILQVKMRNLIESRRKIKQLFGSTSEIPEDYKMLNSLDQEFINKAYKILEQKFVEHQFSVEQFAQEMFVSQSLLYKKIKALTDLNITDFINSYKLKKAVEFIKTTNDPISEIAYKVGFNDPKYFSRIFKKFYGMSPSEFSKNK